MARELTASERALQILAEIEKEEKLKQDRSMENRSSKVDKAAEVKTAVQSQPYQTGSGNPEPASLNLNKLTQNDIVNGFVFSELLNKPLALRPRRRI